jgi:hypothetical protein
MTFALGVLCGFLLGTFCTALGFICVWPAWDRTVQPSEYDLL